jgi:hypothetical protein
MLASDYIIGNIGWSEALSDIQVRLCKKKASIMTGGFRGTLGFIKKESVRERGLQSTLKSSGYYTNSLAFFL